MGERFGFEGVGLEVKVNESFHCSSIYLGCMIEVVQGHILNERLDEIIRNATERLMLVSPYIRLHHRTVDALKLLKQTPEIRLTVCFGKAEGQYEKSFHNDALELLKEMPNIRIVYEERLHAKFYANDNASLFTSMNLYDYSVDNNIEVGVFAADESRSGKKLAVEGWDYFIEVIDNAVEVFDRRPNIEKGFLGLTRGSYIDSTTLRDDLHASPEVSKFTRPKKAVVNPTFETDVKPKKAAEKEKSAKPAATLMGFCIRTGEEIPFNRDVPMSPKAFNSWVRFEDGEYPERYCHFSGEPSYGQTSMSMPILKKNWKKAVNAWEEATGNPIL